MVDITAPLPAHVPHGLYLHSSSLREEDATQGL